MKETKTLALDTSTKSTGYAVYVNGNIKDYGTIHFDAKTPMDMRLGKMILELYKFIDETAPDIVVTEITAVTRNAGVQRYLTYLLGAIMGKCFKDNIFYYTFRPSEWRKLVDDGKKPRKRDELKAWSIATVKNILDIEVNSDDTSDAILIGLAYMNKFSEE